MRRPSGSMQQCARHSARSSCYRQASGWGWGRRSRQTNRRTQRYGWQTSEEHITNRRGEVSCSRQKLSLLLLQKLAGWCHAQWPHVLAISLVPSIVSSRCRAWKTAGCVSPRPAVAEVMLSRRQTDRKISRALVSRIAPSALVQALDRPTPIFRHSICFCVL